MNLDKYKTFLTCAQVRTFYDAADALCLTASTVSKHISSLENELGVTLFERTPKGLVLTAEGVRRLPIIRQLVSTHDRLMSISDEVVVQQDLNICSIPVFARFHLEQMLDEYAAVYPNYPAKILEQQSTRKLIERHEFELAFLHGPTLDDNAFDRIEFVLGRMGIVVSESNPLARQHSVALSELLNFTFVGVDTGVHRTFNEMLFAEMGYMPTINYLLSREDSVLIDVRNHNSIGLLSSEIYDVYKMQGTVFVPFDNVPPSIGVLVRLRNVALSAPAQAFWDFAETWLVQNRNATLSYKDET